MPIVDANVVFDWVAPRIDPEHPSLGLLDRLVGADEDLCAPRLLIAEVCNVLVSGVRRGSWSGAEADRSQLLLSDLPVSLEDDPRDFHRAWWLARRYDNHPFYDLIYVALAERKGMTFVTRDVKLKRRLSDLDFVVEPHELLV